MAFKEAQATLSVSNRAKPKPTILEAKINYGHQPGPGPNAPVLLLLHGHSSSIHEFKNVLELLEDEAEVFSFDQPNCGESGDLARGPVLSGWSARAPYGALYFLRDLTDAFVQQVIRKVIKAPRKIRIAGGSLGGNLTLLLAERNPRYPWLERATLWSPGSAWDTSLGQSEAAGVAYQRAERDWSKPGELRAFLSLTFCHKTIPLPAPPSYPQPWYWYYDCWGETQGPGQCTGKGEGSCPQCKGKKPKLQYGGAELGAPDNYPGMGATKVMAIESALNGLAKNLTPLRAAWHWEIAAEQVELSHLQLLEPDNLPRLASLQCDTRFLAGMEDRHAPAALYQDTKHLFQVARDHFAGRAGAPTIDSQWIAGAGHSIHNEKPKEVADLLLRKELT